MKRAIFCYVVYIVLQHLAESSFDHHGKYCIAWAMLSGMFLIWALQYLEASPTFIKFTDWSTERVKVGFKWVGNKLKKKNV